MAVPDDESNAHLNPMLQPSLSDLLPEVADDLCRAKMALLTGVFWGAIGYALSAWVFPASWREAATGLHPVAWVGYGLASGVSVFFGAAIVSYRRLRQRLVHSSIDRDRLRFFGLDQTASNGKEPDLVTGVISQWKARLRFQWTIALLCCLLVPAYVGVDGLLDGVRAVETPGVWRTCGGLLIGSLVFLLLWILGLCGHRAWFGAIEHCEVLLRDLQKEDGAPGAQGAAANTDAQPQSSTHTEAEDDNAPHSTPDVGGTDGEARGGMSYLDMLDNL